MAWNPNLQLAAKADEIFSNTDRTTNRLSSRSTQAIHAVTHYSPLSLFGGLHVRNRPSIADTVPPGETGPGPTQGLQRVIGADIFDPDGHSEYNPIPGFTRAVFGLKEPGRRGASGTAWIAWFSSTAYVISYSTTADGPTVKGLWASLTDRIGPTADTTEP